jgi:hypothetical protein
MMKSLIQRGFRRSRAAERLGWALLLMLTAVLVFSVIVGIHSLGAA